MNCAVIGGNGYIGKHLCFYLQNMGITPFVYDVQSEIDNIKKILDAQPNMPYAEKQKLYNQ